MVGCSATRGPTSGSWVAGASSSPPFLDAVELPDPHPGARRRLRHRQPHPGGRRALAGLRGRGRRPVGAVRRGGARAWSACSASRVRFEVGERREPAARRRLGGCRPRPPRAHLRARRRPRGRADAPGHPARRRAGRRGVGLRRADADAAHPVGRRRAARPHGGRPGRGDHAAGAPRWAHRPVAALGPRRRRRQPGGGLDQLRGLRRLLAAVPAWPGPGGRVRRRPLGCRPRRLAGRGRRHRRPGTVHDEAATVGDGPFDLSATAWWVRGTVPARET